MGDRVKEFADGNFIVAQLLQFLFERVYKIVRKEENVVCQHFHLFLQCFQKVYVLGLFKFGIMWQRFNTLPHNAAFCHTKAELQIYGAPVPTMQDFIKWRTTFQSNAPIGRILFGCE